MKAITVAPVFVRLALANAAVYSYSHIYIDNTQYIITQTPAPFTLSRLSLCVYVLGHAA
jgi:hypothetical protein